MAEKLLVIGGVAAGTRAAARARRIKPDAEITIITDGRYVSYAACGFPYYLGGVVKKLQELIVRTPDQFKKRQNIDILTLHQATKIEPAQKKVTALNLQNREVIEFNYDRLLIATGARPIVPPFPGVELENIFSLRTPEDALAIRQLLEERRIKNVVIAGAGLIGMEVAENLANYNDLNVTVVDLMEQTLPPFDKEMAYLAERHLKEKRVEIYTCDGIKAFDTADGKTVAKVITQHNEFPAELVILTIGVKPNVEIARNAGVEIGETGAIKVNERMETNQPGIYAAGDCVEVKQLVTKKPAYLPLGSTANKQGRTAGTNMAGGEETFPGAVGSVILKVGELTLAKTGLSEKEAEKLGYNITTSFTEGADRAHYYPGKEELYIKLIADRDTQRLLGAQVIGKSGADKRIDVMGTALFFGITVEQLSKLDMAYSPPYSPALDTLLAAGNVAQNRIEANIPVLSVHKVNEIAKAGEPGIQILDVRTPRECSNTGCIKGAINIPIQQLKDRIRELDKRKKLIVYCDSSQRAFEAAQMLKNQGFQDVSSMEAGIAVWPYELI